MIRFLEMNAALVAATSLVTGCGGGGSEPEPAAPPPVDTEALRRHQAEFQAAYRGGNYVAALDAARATLETAPHLDEPWVWVSSLYSTMGQERQGGEYFDGLTERYPELAKPWFYRGRHQLRTNELEAALASFDRAAELDPADAEAVYWRGVILHGMGDAEAAAVAYREGFALGGGGESLGPSDCQREGGAGGQQVR